MTHIVDHMRRAYQRLDSNAATSTRLVSWADGALDGVLVVLAAWTVTYHAALRFEWSRTFTLIAFLLLVTGIGTAGWTRWAKQSRATEALRSTRSHPFSREPAIPKGVLLAIGGATAAALTASFIQSRGAWWWFWASGLAALLVAVIRAWRRETPREPKTQNSPRLTGAAVVVLLALVFGLASLFVQRPDADDVNLLSRAVHAEEHAGPFATRDTIFSDEFFPASDATNPPTPPTAIEPLYGVIAASSPVTSASVAYLLVAPAVSMLAILALWRLLRTFRVWAPALATATAAAFLLLDGGQNASLGNFSFGRAWQGKVFFLMLVVPLLWHHAITWARDGSRRSLAMLFAANTAALGLTSSTFFVAPIITVIGVVAGQQRPLDPRRLALASATFLYPVVVALAVAAQPLQPNFPSMGTIGAAASDWLGARVHPFDPVMGGIDPGVNRGTDPIRTWQFVFGHGFTMAIPTVAGVAAWAFARDRVTRLALALSGLTIIGIAFAPGVLGWVNEVGGGGVVLWRLLWVFPFPAAVAILLLDAPRRLRHDGLRRALVIALPVGTLTALAVFGTPVPTAENGAQVGHAAWDVDTGSRAGAAGLVRLAEPGDVVAAPEAVSRVIPIMTSKIHPLNPRRRLMRGHHAIKEFHADDRVMVTNALDTGIAAERERAFRHALTRLHVSSVCSNPNLRGSPLIRSLRRAGFQPVMEDSECVYWRHREPEQVLIARSLDLGLPDDRVREFERALDELNVDTVCVRAQLHGSAVTDVLTSRGFEARERGPACVTWKRADPPGMGH